MSPFEFNPDDGGYSFEQDIWSLGCILYELIELNKAFVHLTTDKYGYQYLCSLENQDYLPKFTNNSKISEELKQLVYILLRKNQKDVISVEEIFQIPYF